MNVAQVIPMREDPPLTANSVDLAKRAQQAERALATQETGILFDGDRPYLPAKGTATVLTFAQKQADALFVAPSAVDRVHAMQLAESIKADELAHVVAEQVFNADLSTLTARQKATCRFAAVYALRAQFDCWTDAAHSGAVDAADSWMATEGGKVFRDVSDAQRHALAVHLSSAVICAFLGLMEGSRHIEPGQYIRITEAGR